MPKDDRLYFGHMLDAAGKAVARAKNVTRQEYDRNEDLRIVLVHLVQTIGEAARRVSPEGRESHPEIPRHEIVGMRHKIVHDYMEVDEGVVWSVVRKDLPELLAKLRRFTD
jgi:uncharacterized protein with HEPN domain